MKLAALPPSARHSRLPRWRQTLRKAPTLPALAHKLHLGFDLLEQLLERLVAANMVGKLSAEGWALIRDLEHVQLEELRQLFVFDPQAVPLRLEDGGIGGWLLRMETSHAEARQISLSALFAEAGRVPGDASV